MPRTAPVNATGTRSAGPVGVSRTAPRVDLGRVQAELDRLAAELGAMWSSALERGDFDEVTRLVEASHAIHRAAIALTRDSLAAAWGIPPAP